MAGDTERSLPYLVCWLASQSFFSCPNQDTNGYLALVSPSARQEVSYTSHPYLLLWGGLKLLLSQTSRRLCQQPDQDQ